MFEPMQFEEMNETGVKKEVLPSLTETEKKIIRWASSLPYRCRIYLFGSYMKGTFNVNSDLDIALEFLDKSFNEALGIYFANKSKWMTDLTSELGIRVDLQLYHESETVFIKESLKVSKIILESDMK